MFKKISWGLLVLIVLLALPATWDRVQTEEANPYYEIGVPDEQIEDMADALQSFQDEEDILDELRASGVRSVAVESLTLSDLEDKDIIDEIDEVDLVADYGMEEEELPEHPGLFLKIHEPEHELLEQVETAFNFHLEQFVEEAETTFIDEDDSFSVTSFSREDQEFYYLPYAERLLSMPIGYDWERIEQLADHGFKPLPRPSDDLHYVEDPTHYMYGELERMTEYDAQQVMFLGSEVPGYGGELEGMRVFAENLRDMGYHFMPIEFSDQNGLSYMIRSQDMDDRVIRSISRTIGKDGGNELAEHATVLTRAAKERNIRYFHVNPLIDRNDFSETYYTPQEAQQGLEDTTALAEMIHTDMPASFSGGEDIGAGTFAELHQPTWLKALTILGTIVLSGLLLHDTFPRIKWAGMAGLALIAAAYAVTGMDLLLKGFALLAGVVAAIYAVLSVREVQSWKHLFLVYIRSAAITLLGAWLIIHMLYGHEFIVHTDQFTGVKVLAGLPFAVGGLYIFRHRVLWLLRLQVRYWHLVLLGIAGGLLFFYLMRTGNEGVVLPYEAEIRQGLETILYVRPRTTEFLIGMPFFTLGLYMMMKKDWLAPFFLVFGLLGFASMVGTFTHLHTPLIISGLRMFYGLVIGLGVGMVFIGIYRLIRYSVCPWIKKRWF
ncbi:DUF5693 family protein [Salsuginibacillus kocurii]|uniref:DUF5693 family protein n=1 Tax=Salsuginibacillus kocurii TaxID=427078 RepID=UPI00037174B8|nr:DUF5693 family protein [Salsuginibacillus kocurii]